jgi:AmmeMemoRadiSam system protein A
VREPVYGRAERQTLLRLARETISTALRGGEPRRTEGLPSALQERRGAFVSLHRKETGDLRGCIGYIEPHFALWDTVARAARAAALDDHRFEPVTETELPEIAIQVSVLSLPEPIDPEAVQVGVHGIIVAMGRHRGLLLPQVATDQGWDRETFLDHTCLKAGLPPGSWRRTGVELQGFTAEVFGEDEAE